MTEFDRRTMLTTGALALAGAAAQTTPAAAQAAPKAMFPVPAITIPIVGEAEVFQVRRIYCIGRNYAAHAIERGSDPTRARSRARHSCGRCSRCGGPGTPGSRRRSES